MTLLHGQKLSELIAMNGPVKAALEMWLTQWRPQLMDAWVNYQYLRYQMWPAYEKADLPEAVLFGIMAKESGGKVHAVSRSGAAGPLQFMYATGMRFGLTSDDGFDLRFDPAASARANAEYINEQLRIFNNNLELTLGAYNGGEGRMRRTVGDDHVGEFLRPAHLQPAVAGNPRLRAGGAGRGMAVPAPGQLQPAFPEDRWRSQARSP